jgi:1-acyl-sn-glycerol-3-phosphate acyltransferase
MISTRHHWFIYPFFEWYVWIRMKMHFKAIHITGELKNPHQPLLVIANHFSWWDGFFISSLNRQKWQKKYHVMMLEEQLGKNWFFRYTGAFPVKKNAKSMIESLNFAVNLLQDPENLLTYFPQGKFESMYQHPVHFERGLEWILKNLKNEVQLVFVANQTEYFESPGPHLFIHFSGYNYKGKSAREIANDYSTFFADSSRKNLKIKDL